MPLVKKLIPLGKVSKVVVIPAEWLEYYENQGIATDTILMEVNKIITLRMPDENERAKKVVVSEEGVKA